MRVSIFGAAKEVTGSCYLVEAEKVRFLVDCGAFQGKGEERNRNLEFSPRDVDFVLLTHAHLDHVGRLPLLVKSGFEGDIFGTPPTLELAKIVLYDSAKLAVEEAKTLNKRRLRAGLGPIKPLYTEEDVSATVKLFKPVPYDEVLDFGGGLMARFRDAGHIMGSAMIEIWEGDLKVVFSGDLGPDLPVLHREPSLVESADFVFIESTYGDRTHRSLEDTRAEFEEAIRRALSAGGNVLIPSFAIDRAQRVIYELRLLWKEGKLPGDIPVFLDSPLGIEASKIYKSHLDLYSKNVQQEILRGENPFSLPHLKFVKTVEESKALNDVTGSIIIAGSGMCTGGRILHHLKHHLWKPETSVIIVGYQGRGTLGRKLVEGRKFVKIFGEDVAVRARVYTINGFSAHGDRRTLLRWASNFKTHPTFIVVHGEEHSSASLAEALIEAKAGDAKVPNYGDVLELSPKKRLYYIPHERTTEEEIREAIESIEERISVLKESVPEGDKDKRRVLEVLRVVSFLLGEVVPGEGV